MRSIAASPITHPPCCWRAARQPWAALDLLADVARNPAFPAEMIDIQRKHWLYGTSDGLPDSRGHRSFVVAAPAQAGRTRESMVEVMKEIRGVAGARAGGLAQVE